MIRQTLLSLILSAPIRAYHLFNSGLTSANSGYQPPSQPPRSGGGGGGGSQGPLDGASGLAIATLVLGIGAWTILPILGAVAGAILGWVELNNIKRGESPAAGKTITQIGFWLSVANLALSVLGTCAAFALIFFVYGSLAAMMGAIGLAGAM